MSTLPEERWLEDQLWQSSGAGLFEIVAEIIPGDARAFRQVSIPGVGCADLIAVVPSSQSVLVIELKRTADESSVAQCLRYCAGLEIGLEKSGIVAEVRGAIIAFEILQGALLAGWRAGVSFALVGVAQRTRVILSDEVRDFLDDGTIALPEALSPLLHEWREAAPSGDPV